jgi:hypothetical protein
VQPEKQIAAEAGLREISGTPTPVRNRLWPPLIGSFMSFEEPLQHFSLAMYFLLAVFYTLLPILSGATYGNPRPLYRIIERLKANPVSAIAVHPGVACSTSL